MKIEFHEKENYTIASLEGELDIESSGNFKDEAENKISNGYANMIVDLSKVAYVDSSGLGSLIALQKDARLNGGGLAIVGASEQIRRTMEITQLDKLFEFYDTVEEALNENSNWK